MAIKIEVPRPIMNRWVKMKCFGFRMTAGGWIIGHFRVTEFGDTDDAIVIKHFFGKMSPNDVPVLNQLRYACKLTPVKPGDFIDLPKLNDPDMLGYDTEVLGKPIPNGRYTNIAGFKRIKDEPVIPPPKKSEGNDQEERPF